MKYHKNQGASVLLQQNKSGVETTPKLLINSEAASKFHKETAKTHWKKKNIYIYILGVGID